MASTTATQPAGIASMAARVEMGELHDAGVARSSRAGTKRRVKARATKRDWPGRIGRVPRSQTLRRPFFSSKVVKVAVVTCERVCTTAGSRSMGMGASFIQVSCRSKFTKAKRKPLALVCAWRSVSRHSGPSVGAQASPSKS